MQRYKWMFGAMVLLAIGALATAQQQPYEEGQEQATLTGAQETQTHQILTADQADNMLKQTNFSLADCIRVAEQRTNGKVVRAAFLAYNPNTMTGKAGGDYVCGVTCVASGKFTCVLIDPKDGNVIETRNIQTLAEMPFEPHYALTGMEEQGQPGQYTPGATAGNYFQPARRWQKCTDLLHKDIDDSQNNKVGKVKDLAIDPDAGRVFVVIGTLEGRGDKYFPIPWGACKLSTDYKDFVLNITKDRLNEAQGFDKNNWPNLASERWLSDVYVFYGATPYWTSGRAMVREQTPSGTRQIGYTERMRMWTEVPAHWQKANDVVGMTIKNPQNEDLGKIENLAIDADTGRIMYAIVQFGGFLGLGEKLAPVPWTVLTPAGDYKHFVLNIDKDQLKTAPGTFEKSKWPNLNDPEWGREVYKFYNQTPYWEYPDRAREEGHQK